MTAPRAEGDLAEPSPWRILGPLAGVAVVAAAVTLVVLFLTYISWGFGGSGTPAGDFGHISGLFVVGMAPAVALLALSLQSRPRRSITAAAIALAVIVPVSSFFAPLLISTSEDYGERLYAESLPLLPSETAFTVDEATVIAAAERDATIEFLGVEPDSSYERSESCLLSTGIPGTMPYVIADILLSDWATTSRTTVPDALRLHWEELGYEATVRNLDGDRIVVNFVSSGEPELQGSAFWETERFWLRIDGPCLEDATTFSDNLRGG